MKIIQLNEHSELKIEEHKDKANGFSINFGRGITEVNLVIDIPEYKTFRELADIFAKAAEQYENRK